MASNVTVYQKAFTDARFKILGKLIGTSRFDARGRCEELWSHCTEEQIYTLPTEIVDAIAEKDGFAEALVKAGLGENLPDGMIRVKGTGGRIEWLGKTRSGNEAGGIARAQTAQRNEKGQFIPKAEKVIPPDSPVIPSDPAPVQHAGESLDQQAGPASPGRSSFSISYSSSSKILSLPQIFLERISKLPDKARERDRTLFLSLLKNFGDPEEIACIVQAVEARGVDIRGSPIGSVMGYLEHAYLAERDLYRAEGERLRKAEENTRAAEEAKNSTEAQAERENQEFMAREKAFLVEFPGEEERTAAVKRFTELAVWIRDYRSEVALKFAVNRWWQEKQETCP